MKIKGSIPPGAGAEPAQSDSDAARATLAWAVESGRSEDLVRCVARGVRRTRQRRARMAVCALVAILAGGVALRPWRGFSAPSPAAPDPQSSVVSTPGRQVLPDGSIVELRDGARIVEAFSPAVRRVFLERGEAHFKVTQNSARPFVVVAGLVEARAVGTAFSVQRGASAVEVLVDEGRVAVQKQSAAAALVPAGNRAEVNLEPPPRGEPAPLVLPVTAAEMSARLSWRLPHLEFNGAPLAVAIPMFNRYGGAHLTLDPALSGLLISGSLRADDTPALLRLLRDEFDIVAARGDGADIILRRR